jgi:small subunit ribosomal protein S20
MPILKHAKKKLRQERKREVHNRSLRTAFKNLLKTANKVKTPEAISKAVSSVDKAAKKNLIHKNKAAHIKSDLSKLTVGSAEAAPAKKAEAKKAPAKKEAPAKGASKKPTKKAASKKSGKK